MSLRDNRRNLLKTLGLLGIGSTFAGHLAAKDVGGAGKDNGVCVLTPEQTEGPYYLSLRNQRSDITEGKLGMPLSLSLTVVDVKTCQPVTDAVVDIWHCDADGVYSGYDSVRLQRWGHQEVDNADRYLRGIQITDGQGAVNFKTIYPGCYSSRTTHIHAKIYLNERELLTTQCYFPDQITDHIYTTSAHYRSGRDTRNTDDRIMQRAGAAQKAMLTIEPDTEGYSASLTIGVLRS